jgi:hypothetical protein
MARDDGLADGSLVTLTSLDHVDTFRFRFVWVGLLPTPDTTSVASLQPDGIGAYSFSPDPGVYGSWLIELITDEGTPGEDRSIKVWAVKQSPTAIRIPAPNEKGVPDAALFKNGPTEVARTDFNQAEASGPWVDGRTVSWWLEFATLIFRFNGGGGGLAFTDEKSANYVASYGQHVLMNGGHTISLPSAAASANGQVAALSTSGTPIVAATGGDTIAGSATYVFSAVGQSTIFQSDGVDTWHIVAAYAGGGA